MNKFRRMVAITLLALAGAGVMATPLPAAEEVGNTVCPVSGEEVGKMGKVVQVEYNGKLYNLCCPMCKKDFFSDPEKYGAIAEEQAASVTAGKAAERDLGMDYGKGAGPSAEAHEHGH